MAVFTGFILPALAAVSTWIGGLGAMGEMSIKSPSEEEAPHDGN